MKMVRFGSIQMIAPIFCRIAMRSMISGSIAAFFSSVTPLARTAVSSTCSVAPTLGYGSSMFGAVQAVGGRDADALVALVDDRTERAQGIHVEVDRPVADAAAAEVGDERLAEAVQQRSAEQDRDAAGAGERVDLGEVGACARSSGRAAARRLRRLVDRDAVGAEHAA